MAEPARKRHPFLSDGALIDSFKALATRLYFAVRQDGNAQRAYNQRAIDRFVKALLTRHEHSKTPYLHLANIHAGPKVITIPTLLTCPCLA